MARAEKRPRLTLKAAKVIAVKEFGTAAGLAAHENNNAEYQRYEMRIGNIDAVITNAYSKPGIAFAYLSRGGEWTYYDIATLEENITVTERERRKYNLENIRDAAATSPGQMLTALIDEHGLDNVRRMLDVTVTMA